MITGKQSEREVGGGYTLKTGMFNAKPVMVNPTKEELSSLLGVTFERDYDYITRADDGTRKALVSIWLKETKNGGHFNVRFYLEEKNRESTKNPGSFQYINTLGTCTWTSDTSLLPSWFASDRDYRKSFIGEEEMHEFLRSWLSNLDFDDSGTKILLDTPKIFDGDFSELKDAIQQFTNNSICCMATVRTVVNDGKTNQYQGVYNKHFLPGSYINFFRPGSKGNSKIYDRFVKGIKDPIRGCKDIYKMCELEDYNPAPVTNNAVVLDTNY